MPGNEVFPTWIASQRLPFDNEDIDTTVFDAKFYPYETEDNDQIVAVVAADTVVVLRPTQGADRPFDILCWFQDEQTPQACYNSLCWTKHPSTRNPILCIAGSEPKHIKILDIESGRPIRTIAGHGREINDLAVSPVCTNLIASASNDNTIRLWNIGEEYQQQPCVALFAGGGHKAPVLAIRFHPNGRWLLSGGIDTAVCLWAIPSDAELDQGTENSPYRATKIVHYPHFFSTEVHPNYVDCLAFYGDLIISKAARADDIKDNEIQIWKIDGFNSEAEVPEEPPIPVPGNQTRSSFPHDSRFRGFQRLLTLDIPNTSRFYHRFGLLHAPGMRPILAMGNEQSAYSFWDLQRLDEGIDPKERPKPKKTAGRGKANVLKESLTVLPSSDGARDGARSSTRMRLPIPHDFEADFLPS
ncbi:hypothetical protein M409DRAFT_50333 [Zasmidium cellare ATCC 36951]|uniref:Uncharacterized protein n=1 Tax=Zasmidium cellare ATCC 36951 TaxID=1080233 RepID=A0A6A6CWT4_ZASCE|nr:uncharacterized protein M409DRAFT_50333 [Zasmidium cellare ATCC 36951]KAF2171667.1 hypothetical protein M409DRAFT_50333 [Zasmidium cellare ATCC 36951]